MKQNLSNEKFTKLSIVEVPDGVIGNIHQFRNFDPSRIVHYELKNERLLLFMDEEMRLEAMAEFRSTAEAFHYEVGRGVRPEVEAFYRFDYKDDFSELLFTVDRIKYEQDISAEMIEMSIVEDAIKYQIYSRRAIHVQVKYIDYATNQIFVQRNYPVVR
ncbi:hypothetical protein [Solibacillus daqui]|uniref:hypothetical protein n=1 Tax=Solibacillus daqui TaxID=2912187 RepID=UPI00236702A9|nr:hypothetical protein [Solibacillus daqui]